MGQMSLEAQEGQQYGNVGHTAAAGCIYESMQNQPGPGAALLFRFRASRLAMDFVPDP